MVVAVGIGGGVGCVLWVLILGDEDVPPFLHLLLLLLLLLPMMTMTTMMVVGTILTL